MGGSIPTLSVKSTQINKQNLSLKDAMTYFCGVLEVPRFLWMLYHFSIPMWVGQE